MDQRHSDISYEIDQKRAEGLEDKTYNESSFDFHKLPIIPFIAVQRIGQEYVSPDGFIIGVKYDSMWFRVLDMPF